MWLFSPVVPQGLAKKFHRPWTGPYRALASLSDSTFTTTKSRWSIFDHLKACQANTSRLSLVSLLTNHPILDLLSNSLMMILPLLLDPIHYPRIRDVFFQGRRLFLWFPLKPLCSALVRAIDGQSIARDILIPTCVLRVF